MRIAAGVLIAVPFVLLPLLWALALLPLGGLLPLLSAPLAIRLGERASHRSGATPGEILREALLALAVFVGLLAVGLSLPVGAG